MAVKSNVGLQIGKWTAGLDRSVLSQAVIEKLKLATLDTIAAILSGVNESVVQRVMTYVSETEGQGQISIVGHIGRASLTGAALINGTMAHACDYDDLSWTMWGHPSAPVVPAVLAVAEQKKLSGIDFLIGLAVGIEVEKTLGLACQPEHYLRGYHPTGSIGVFGAAAGAAKMLNLEPEGVQMALGLSASRAAGLRINFGTMTKPLHVGFAARDGIEAALLAGLGVTASPKGLDGPFGFFDVGAPDHKEVGWIVDRLGNPFEVIEPGLLPKLYPSCSETHASVDAILEMRAEGLRPSDVKLIRAGVTPAARDNLTYDNPTTPLQAKFSQTYCLAAPLVHGKLGLAEFDTENIMNPAVRDLINRVEVKIHPDLSGSDLVSFSSPAIIEVETIDGRTLKKIVREMRGSPQNPLTTADIEAKFIECGDRVLPRSQVRSALAKIGRLQRTRNPSAN